MNEGPVCVCCMGTDDLVELFATKNENNVEENFAKMLAACLNIQVVKSDGLNSICATCVVKLNACVAFKKQAVLTIAILSFVDVKTILSPDESEVLGFEKSENKIKTEDVEQHEDKNNSEPLVINLSSSAISSDEDNDRIKEPPTKPRAGRPRDRSRSPDFILPSELKDEQICRECGQEFSSTMSLKVHYNVHYGRHICDICDKRFMTYASLRKHENSHLTDPLCCADCGKTFYNLNTLNSHKRYKHGNKLPYRCRICKQRFRTLTQRLKHLAEVHQLNEKRYPCPQCHLSFLFSGQRSKHIAKVHEVKVRKKL